MQRRIVAPEEPLIISRTLLRYLRVELLNPIYEAIYRAVFVAFKEKLTSVLVDNGVIIPMEQPSPSDSTMSLWDLMTSQDKFISGILACQIDSLAVRGKKDAKEAHLREALMQNGFSEIPHAVPLPSAPHIWVKGVDCNSAKMFKSALYPAVLDFVVDDDVTGPGKKTKKSPKPQKDASKSMCKVMIKTGDDLRQDQLVINCIQLMDRLLKRGTLDLW